MDQVCAKGTTGSALDYATIHRLVMDFSHRSATAQINGSLAWRIETDRPSHVQVRVPGAAADVALLRPVEIRVVDANVRLTGDLNLAVRTSAAMTRALTRHQVALDGFAARHPQMAGWLRR